MESRGPTDTSKGGELNDYLIDRDRRQARRRLGIKQSLQDPATFEYLARLGVGPGWRCLEVGSGAGTVAEWLCRRVAPAGRVVATDRETDLMAERPHDCLEIRRHDIAVDPLEESSFDLVHARDLLVHVPDRLRVLNRLWSALEPGGWILIEEPDAVTDAPDVECDADQRRLYRHVVSGIYAFLRERGVDPALGRRLPGLLARSGFVEVGAEGRVRWFRGVTEGTRSPHMMAFADLAAAVVDAGFVRRADFDAFLDLTREPGFIWSEALTVSAWGRKPGATTDSRDRA